MHQPGKLPGKQHQHNRHHRRQNRKQADARADYPARLPRIALANLLAQQHRHAHRQAHQHRRHAVHQLAARGHGGYVRRGGILPDDQQIDRAVHRLQKQRSQHRQRKSDQRHENSAFCKILCLFHLLHPISPKKAG